MGTAYSAGDRLLFWLCNKTGASVDRAYGFRPVRLAMMLADKFEGRLSRTPR